MKPHKRSLSVRIFCLIIALFMILSLLSGVILALA